MFSSPVSHGTGIYKEKMMNPPTMEELAKALIKKACLCSKCITEALTIAYAEGYKKGEEENKTSDAYFERLRERAKAEGKRDGIEDIENNEKWHRAGYQDGILASSQVVDKYHGTRSTIFLAKQIRSLLPPPTGQGEGGRK